MAQVAFDNCDICEKQPRNEYCLDCEQHFCQPCKTLHLKSKTCKDHMFSSSKGAVRTKCSDHKEDFIFVCIDCDVPICKLCVTKSHNGHKLLDIKESISSLETNIRTEIDCKTKLCHGHIQEIQKNIENLQRDAKKMIAAANEDARKAKEIVDTHIASVIVDIKEQTQKEVEKLESLKLKAHESFTKTRLLEEKFKSLKNPGDNFDFMKQLKQLDAETKSTETLKGDVVIGAFQYTPGECNPNAIRENLGRLWTEYSRTICLRTEDVDPEQTEEKTQEVNDGRSNESDERPDEYGGYVVDVVDGDGNVCGGINDCYGDSGNCSYKGSYDVRRKGSYGSDENNEHKGSYRGLENSSYGGDTYGRYKGGYSGRGTGSYGGGGIESYKGGYSGRGTGSYGGSGIESYKGGYSSCGSGSYGGSGIDSYKAAYSSLGIGRYGGSGDNDYKGSHRRRGNSSYGGDGYGSYKGGYSGRGTGSYGSGGNNSYK